MVGKSILSPKHHLLEDSVPCHGLVITQESLEIRKRQRI